MKILQINLNHSKVPQDLVNQVAAEMGIDILIASGYYRSQSNWFTDMNGRAALWVRTGRGSPSIEHAGEPGTGFVSIKVGRICYFTCCFSPDDSIEIFEYEPGLLEKSIRRDRGLIVIAGDFNAKSPIWGSRVWNREADFAPDLDLTPLKRNRSPTFISGVSTSRIDIAFGNLSVVRRTTRSEVLNQFTGSDHQYIYYCID